MAVSVTVLVPPKQLENSQTTQYTAVNVRAIIDKATVTNTSASYVTLSVNLVNAAGTAADSNLVMKARSIAPSETYLCQELIGQVLTPSQFISTLASAATSLTMRVSGREVT